MEQPVWKVEQPPFWHSGRRITALMFALNGIALYWGCALGTLPPPPLYGGIREFVDGRRDRRRKDSKVITRSLTPSLFGYDVYGVEIYQPRCDYALLGNNRIPSYITRNEVEMQARFVLDRVACNSLNDTLGFYYKGCMTNVTSLGDSVLCGHCGFYYKPGVLTCHRCGSVMKRNVPISRYKRIGSIAISSVQWEQRAAYDFTDSFLCDVSFYFYPEHNDCDLRSIFNGWHTTHVEQGWICDYCHCINSDDNVDCKFCSAGRLPFSDLARIDSHCLYCGTKLQGATVCKNCSSAQNGYSAWMPRCDYGAQ